MKGIQWFAVMIAVCLGGCEHIPVVEPVDDKKRQVVIKLDERGCPVSAIPVERSCPDQKKSEPDAICAKEGDPISWQINSRAPEAEFRILFDKKDARYPTDCGRASVWQPAGSVVRCTVNVDVDESYYYKIELQTEQFECGLDPTIYVSRN